MKNLPLFYALLSAGLIASAGGRAWPDPAAPEAAVATPQRQPGWFAPVPGPGGYARPWLQTAPWPAGIPGYVYTPPPVPPYGQYAASVKPPVNPLQADLDEARQQLTAQSAGLESANATIEQLQRTVQDGIASGQALGERLADSNRELTSLRQQHQTLTADRDRLRDDLATRGRELAAAHARLQGAARALQEAQAESDASSRQLGAAMTQLDTLRNQLTALAAHLQSQASAAQDTAPVPAADAAPGAEMRAAMEVVSEAGPVTGQAVAGAAPDGTDSDTLAGLRSQLQNQGVKIQNLGQTLAAVTIERDGILADMTSVIAERDKLQKELALCQRKLGQADADTARGGTNAATAPN